MQFYYYARSLFGVLFALCVCYFILFQFINMHKKWDTKTNMKAKRTRNRSWIKKNYCFAFSLACCVVKMRDIIDLRALFVINISQNKATAMYYLCSAIIVLEWRKNVNYFFQSNSMCILPIFHDAIWNCRDYIISNIVSDTRKVEKEL